MKRLLVCEQRTSGCKPVHIIRMMDGNKEVSNTMLYSFEISLVKSLADFLGYTLGPNDMRGGVRSYPLTKK